MNLKKNQTLVTVVVLFVALGLVLAYVPLLFAPSAPDPAAYYPQEEQAPAQFPQTADIGASAGTPKSDIKEEVVTPTSTPDKTEIPASFSGLEEESDSLDGLLNF
jgi:hypothetical protein